MLFPTVDFAVFFVVVFTVSWLTRPYKRVWRWVILAVLVLCLPYGKVSR